MDGRWEARLSAVLRLLWSCMRVVILIALGACMAGCSAPRSRTPPPEVRPEDEPAWLKAIRAKDAEYKRQELEESEAFQREKREKEATSKRQLDEAIMAVRLWRKGYVTEAVGMAASDVSLDDICDAAESRATQLWNDMDAPLGLVISDVRGIKATLLDKARKDAKSEVIRVRMLPADQRQPGPYIEPADDAFPIRHPDSNRG